MTLTRNQELEYYKMKLEKANNKSNNNPGNDNVTKNKGKYPGLKRFDSEIFFTGLSRYPLGHLVILGVGIAIGVFL